MSFRLPSWLIITYHSIHFFKVFAEKAERTLENGDIFDRPLLWVSQDFYRIQSWHSEETPVSRGRWNYFRTEAGLFVRTHFLLGHPLALSPEKQERLPYSFCLRGFSWPSFRSWSSLRCSLPWRWRDLDSLATWRPTCSTSCRPLPADAPKLSPAGESGWLSQSSSWWILSGLWLFGRV